MRIVKIFSNTNKDTIEQESNEWLIDLDNSHKVCSVEMEFQTTILYRDCSNRSVVEYSIVMMVEVDGRP